MLFLCESSIYPLNVEKKINYIIIDGKCVVVKGKNRESGFMIRIPVREREVPSGGALTSFFLFWHRKYNIVLFRRGSGA